MPAGPAATKPAARKSVPVPNGGFNQLIDLLAPEERAVVEKVGTDMKTKVEPIINKYWSDDAFPFELLLSFNNLGLGGIGFQSFGCAGGGDELFGVIATEIARVAPSICSFCGVRSDLAMGSVHLDGSGEQTQQRQKWFPPMGGGKRSTASA